MRIYDFLEYYPNPYKPSIDTEVVELLRAGHDVTVFAQGAYTSTLHDAFVRNALHKITRYYPATLKDLGRHGSSLLRVSLAAPVRQSGRIRAIYNSQRSWKQNFLNAARALLLPAEPPDICYVHNIVTASRLRFLRSLYPTARLCMYFHGGEVGGHRKVDGEAEIFAQMDAVVSNTRVSAEQVIGRGCPSEKVAVVPVGFELADYVPSSPRRYRPDGLLRLVSIGRMSPEKGISVALLALKSLLGRGYTDFTYRLIGTGTYMNELRELVATLELGDHVKFLGEKKKSEVAQELGAADVLLLPSLVTDTWAETQAAVVQEAALMKCLCITTIAGGVPESTPPELLQFSVPPGEVDALAESIMRMMDMADTDFIRLGDAARVFGERYDISPLMQRIVQHACGQLPRSDSAWYSPRGIV